MKPLAVGDPVKIRSLRRNGEVIEVLSSGRYRVAVGALSMTCRNDDLELVLKKAPTKQKQVILKEHPATVIGRQNRPNPTLDLHGKRVSDAVADLSAWLDKVILADLDRVTVIHGHGTGKVQKAVHTYLRTIAAVKSFRINELNTGETLVYL